MLGKEVKIGFNEQRETGSLDEIKTDSERHHGPYGLWDKNRIKPGERVQGMVRGRV